MKWLLKDKKLGTVTEFTSFPYAFRTMFNVIKKGVETGRKHSEMMTELLIISPQTNRDGSAKIYNYNAAKEMASASGLLTPDGTINSREFRRS